MAFARSPLRLRKLDERRLLFGSSRGRRVLFGLIAAVLLAAAAYGIQWEDAGEPSRPVGTMFFALLVLGSAGVAGFDSRALFDLAEGTVRFRARVFGIRLGHRVMNLAEIDGVVLQKVTIVDLSGVRSRVGFLHGRLHRRAALYRLYLESQDERTLLEESNDGAHLSSTAERIAQFTDLPYRFEES